MQKQIIQIDEILFEANVIRKARGESKMTKSELAVKMFSGNGWSDSYCRYRLHFISQGKVAMTIGDLFGMYDATGLAFLTLLAYISPIKNNTNGRRKKISQRAKTGTVGLLRPDDRVTAVHRGHRTVARRNEKGAKNVAR